MTVEELMNTNSKEKVEKLTKAQLQIMILCPNMVTKLGDLKRDIPESDNLFKADKILVMLLGVEKDNVLSENIKGENCTNKLIKYSTLNKIDNKGLSETSELLFV